MDTKKLVMAAVAAAVVTLVLGFTFHELIFGSALREAYPNMRTEPQPVPLIAGALLLGVLMAYMYPQGYKGGSPAMEGAKFGALVGLLTWGPALLTLTAVLEGLDLSSTLIADIAWHMVEQGAAGAAVGMVYGRS